MAFKFSPKAVSLTSLGLPAGLPHQRSPGANNPREGERDCLKQEPWSPYNLGSEVTCPCFHCILRVESKPPVLVSTEDVNPRAWDPWRPSATLPPICGHKSTVSPKQSALFPCTSVSREAMFPFSLRAECGKPSQLLILLAIFSQDQ